jgi:hypothetical protein
MPALELGVWEGGGGIGILEGWRQTQRQWGVVGDSSDFQRDGRWFIGFWAAVCLCSLCCWAGEWRCGNLQLCKSRRLLQWPGKRGVRSVYVSLLQATPYWRNREVALMMMNRSGSHCFCLAHFGLAFALVLGFGLANWPLLIFSLWWTVLLVGGKAWHKTSCTLIMSSLYLN